MDSSTTCKKSKDTPAKCALCGEDHPANCKGCERYNEILQGHNPNRTHNTSIKVTSDAPSPHSPTPHNPLQQQHCSYAEVTGNRSLPPDEPPAALKTFLEEFKNLFAQLIEPVCDQVQIASALLPYRRRKAGVSNNLSWQVHRHH